MTIRNVVGERIRAEYLEMPGMKLTKDQVARLCGIERSACETVLAALVDARFLSLTPDGTYVRRHDEVTRTRMTPSQPARHARRPTNREPSAPELALK